MTFSFDLSLCLSIALPFIRSSITTASSTLTINQMSDTKIGVLDFAHSDYDGNNVTIELFLTRNSSHTVWPIPSVLTIPVFMYSSMPSRIFQKVPILQQNSRFFLFYKVSEYGGPPDEPHYARFLTNPKALPCNVIDFGSRESRITTTT